MTRVLLTVALFAVWAILVWLMIRAWRRRGELQEGIVGALAPVPGTLGDPVLGPSHGLYVGSTLAPSWINRVAVGDLGDRANADLLAFDDGLLLARQGAADVWIPRDQVLGLRTERGLAGKVMTKDGLLVIRWRTSTGAEIDSGFRAVDKNEYPAWIALWQDDPDSAAGPAADTGTASGTTSSPAASDSPAAARENNGTNGKNGVDG
ncbi:PH-like domain-containing protein [Lolliginicoccus lacisalsi]|uniref:PH-like domain-containing protein n=1 Tax=Lolliginicoccus lacisalsi TaxID=2742202 RepID=UPI001CDCF240|nr:transporter [Lolliginicoccus lacisalsi]